jgi:hypothetical protein
VDSILLAISLSSPELYHQDFPISGLAFNMALSDPPMTNVFQPHSAGQECMVSILYRYTIIMWGTARMNPAFIDLHPICVCWGSYWSDLHGDHFDGK